MSAHPSTIVAFEQLSSAYDDIFTNTVIGRAQRDVVWQAARKLFKPGEQILELNCGTGEDAAYLASLGVTVHACDASPGMVARARERVTRSGVASSVSVDLLATEELKRLDGRVYDGAFSNFSGLNCVENHLRVAEDLYPMIRPGGKALFCLSSRYCAFETLWYLAHGKFKKAARRWPGFTVATFGVLEVPIWYPSVGELKRAFAPRFRLTDISAVGLCIPPSYAEAWAARNPRTFSVLAATDRALRDLPLLRLLGDHVLLTFERCK